MAFSRWMGGVVDHFKLVFPEHLNHHGFLFGGNLLKWIDEFAYVTARLEFPGCRFVTVALDDVVFKHGIHNGQVLKFSIEAVRVGTTSVTYAVRVRDASGGGRLLFETRITLVNVDADGHKQPIR